MDPDELTAFRAQISGATAPALAATSASAQDKIEAEAAHDLIVADLAKENSLISQLTAAIPVNSTLTVPPFCLTPGQISPDLILNYTNKNNSVIYDKSIIPFKLTFDGSIYNIKIFMDNIM